MLMMRSLMSWALVAIAAMGCAPAVNAVRPTLSATDSGTIWLASAGTLVRSAEGSENSAFRQAAGPFRPSSGARLRRNRRSRSRVGTDTPRVGLRDIRRRQLLWTRAERGLYERGHLD